jgi:hypothetical protein
MAKPPPFSHVGINVFTLLLDLKVISVACLSPRISNWAIIPDESTAGVFIGLEMSGRGAAPRGWLLEDPFALKVFELRH